jgi:DNA-binding NtrC family response regulator
LITGETGTGKEVAARAIHALSKRREKSLLCVNCAALSAGLLESELFGHEKGAFTGAERMREGRFSLADGGAIILDEIGELHMDLQSKLLRVLQTRAFERVGSSQTIKVDVRVMATTNRDLQADVARGRFREDLYYRLNVLHVHMPPLRERSSEVTLFLEHFLKKGGRETSRFAPEALDALTQYSWPGNVRELENLVESLLTLEDSHRVEIEHLPLRIRESCGSKNGEAVSFPMSLKRLLEEVERRHIREVLDIVSWNQRGAAEILQIGRNRLARKMREYDLQPPVPIASSS